MNTHLGYTGICSVDVIENGEVVQSVEVKNQLTYGGQYCMLTALTPAINCQLTKAIIGNDNTVAPSISNTIGQFSNEYKKFVQFTTPTLTEPLGTIDLQVGWRLEVSEYNGLTISEIGLLFNDPAGVEFLFCRVTLSGVDQIFKTANTSLNGIWTITVTES